MGVVREPTLYRCAVGYAGVYDLPTRCDDDAGKANWSRSWANDWLSDPAALSPLSPNRLADQIKTPVLLAAGGEDEIAPIRHSRMMEKALKAANVPVQTLYYDTEGHGFSGAAHRREFYTRLQGFLNRHTGGATALPAAAPGKVD